MQPDPEGTRDQVHTLSTMCGADPLRTDRPVVVWARGLDGQGQVRTQPDDTSSNAGRRSRNGKPKRREINTSPSGRTRTDR